MPKIALVVIVLIGVKEYTTPNQCLKAKVALTYRDAFCYAV